jgi:YheC/D like ATP-grasp
MGASHYNARQEGEFAVSAVMTGELVWMRGGPKMRLGLYIRPKDFAGLRSVKTAKVSNIHVPIFSELPRQNVVYRHPIQVTHNGAQVTAGPVFAILAASGETSFIGSRGNFRDIMDTARKRNGFVYVLPVREVNEQLAWVGYVRIGYQRWLAIPCPQPEAVYNRIPNRVLEHADVTAVAKERLRDQQIPMFNPDYFNKARIYEVIRNAKLQKFLPDTADVCTANTLRSMLYSHASVYLKPAGGSIGHGMILITRNANTFNVSVLKNSRCQTLSARGFANLWGVVQRQRLPGHYVIQEAIPLLEWQGRPCDFRVLLQKKAGEWHVVGKGVRVSGANTITTHVPNGGTIASANRVLGETFTDQASNIEGSLDSMAVSCAGAIDVHYGNSLGEMSMDIGLDRNGHLWFFEANAKPMKFDERDIRSRSLIGVVSFLEELRQDRPIIKK